MVELFTGLLAEAASAGVIRADLQHERVAGAVLQAVMFNAFASTISGLAARQSGASAAEELWDLVFHGISTR
jgi:hypothetical protein